MNFELLQFNEAAEAHRRLLLNVHKSLENLERSKEITDEAWNKKVEVYEQMSAFHFAAHQALRKTLDGITELDLLRAEVQSLRLQIRKLKEQAYHAGLDPTLIGYAKESDLIRY